MTRTAAGLFGIVAAALVPATVIALTAPLSGHFSLPMALATFVFVYPIALAVVGIAGLVVHFALHRIAQRCWWCLMIAGLGTGVAFAFAVFWPATPPLGSGLYYGLMGAVSALVFWLIWRRGQTDIG